MKIETLDEWNDVADKCGCCPMPSVQPSLYPESIEVTVVLCGVGGGVPNSDWDYWDGTAWVPYEVSCAVGYARFKKVTYTDYESRSDQGSVFTIIIVPMNLKK
jgi:hypothetical protein